MNAPAAVALVVAAIMAFVALWCAIVLLLSYVGGWQRLGKSYAGRVPPHGQKHGWQSGRVGWESYRNALTLHTAQEGLFLSLPILFRMGHKNLFIPWSALRNEKPVSFLWYKAIRFQVGSPPIAEVELPVVVFEGRDRTR